MPGGNVLVGFNASQTDLSFNGTIYYLTDTSGTTYYYTGTGVTQVGGFTSKTALVSATIGSGVTSIGSNAFKNCTNLKTVTFSTVTSGVTLSSLQATTYSDSIYLYWTTSSTLTPITYNVYDSSYNSYATDISNQTFFAITSLQPLTSYTFIVRPYYNGSAGTSSTTTATTTSYTYYTPKSYDTLLKSTYNESTTSLSTVSTITNRNRYMINLGTNNYLAIQSTTSSTNFTASTNTIASLSTSTYQKVLGSIFQFTQNTFDSSNNNLYYRIDSELHSNFSLDCSWNTTNSYSPNLQFLNNWGGDRTTDTSFNQTTITFNAGNVTDTSGNGGPMGYIVFEFDASYNRLTARKRYYYDSNYYINTGKTASPTSYTVYNAGGGGEGHILDSKFPYAGYYLYFNGTTLMLSTSYSSITMYSSPVDLSVPSQFNPLNVIRATNLTTSLYTAGMLAKGLTALYRINYSVVSKLATTYIKQIFTYDSSMTITNKATADSYAYSMLDTIFTTNSSLRYTKEFYKTLRDGLLKNVTSSHSLANAYLTGKTVLQVYFTNQTDSSGNYHPFMVILNTSSPTGPARFMDVARPPGDAINHVGGTDGSYPNSYVTRNALYQSFLTKIPMRGDYGVVDNVVNETGNANLTVMKSIVSLAQENGSTSYDYFNYASKSSCGIAIDSTQLYPVLNNALIPSCGAGELTALGHHSGQGLGTHYHADSFQCGKNNVNFYNKTDYVGQSHPPLIGMAFDGIALYGSYVVGYDVLSNVNPGYTYDMDGSSNTLDSFGGHTHGIYGYHYHAAPISSLSIPCYASKQGASKYPVYALLYGSWKGNVSAIPYFTSLDQPSQQNVYTGFASNIS